MATGTGKTFTSLASSKEYKKYNKRVARVILVPFLHLIDQWVSSCRGLGISNIITCSSDSKLWELGLSSAIRDYNMHLTDSITIILTYDTSSLERFQFLFDRIENNIFLIADECHYMGTKSMNISIFDRVKVRLGLSATPDRWWDEEGTDKIFKFFDKTVFEYTLEKAIREGYLSEYRYNPIVVNLGENELVEYDNLTSRLISLINTVDVKPEDLTMLKLRRKNVLNNAEEKTEKLFKIFNEKEKNMLSNTLVYCSPQNILQITKGLGDMGYRVRKFNYEVNNPDRQKIISEFKSGKIQILTAIRCLDEGVDIPSVRDAYFLASTSNPKQFIQRRGRILRPFKGKIIANVFDFIIIPDGSDDNLFKSVVKQELPRFAEFSINAINSSLCRSEVQEILKKYNLEYLMDKLPWDVYHEEKEMFDYGN